MSLQSAVAMLRRRLLIVLVCVITVPAVAFEFSWLQDKQYTASASLLFRDPALDQKLFGSDFIAPAQDPTRAAATNEKLVSLKAIAERTARALRTTLTADDVARKVDVEGEGQADLVSVSATDRTPRFASRLANTFAEQYIAFRRQADRAKVRDAQELVQQQLQRLSPSEREGAEGSTLRKQADQLDVLASLQTGNAELVQRAQVPASASSPKTSRNVAIGAVLGVLLAIGLALLLEKLDRRVRDPQELEESFGRPLLGVVPQSRSLYRTGPTRETTLPALEEESFSMLRANLRYFNVEGRVRSVLVTSAAPGDGKSTVAWNLGWAAANAGATVLIIEADLRHPMIAASTESLMTRPGLSDVLAGHAQPSEAIQRFSIPNRFNTDADRSSNSAPVRTMDVMVAGPIPPNPVDLLESDRMAELVAKTEEIYEFVVVDSPPTAVVPDAIPLIDYLDGVIVVSRLGVSTRGSVLQLRNQLQNLRAPLLGIVVNGAKADAGGYGYGGSYGYGAQASGRNGGSPQARRARLRAETRRS